MNDVLMYAKYNQASNKTVIDLLDKMSNDEREKDRGSFYRSFSGLLRHISDDGVRLVLGMYKTGEGKNAAVLKILSEIEKIPLLPKESLSETQWKEFKSVVAAMDAAYVNVAEVLEENDLNLPIKIDWFGGNPVSVPFSYLLNLLLVNGVHHRGQISQIFDTLKIENDYAAIDPSFILPKI